MGGCQERWRLVVIYKTRDILRNNTSSTPFFFLCYSPPPPQTPTAAEPDAGLLPAGQPAQHGVGVHAHLRDLWAGARRGRLPLHGLRLAGDLRLLGSGWGWGGGWEGERDIFRCWEDRGRAKGKRGASEPTRNHQTPRSSPCSSTQSVSVHVTPPISLSVVVEHPLLIGQYVQH